MHSVEAKGFKIPLVGLGTWTLGGRDCARLVEQAIRIGYRHIDSAQMYGNEREVGEGVRASGLRFEVMVTTKIQPSLLAPRDVERSVKESLAQLRLDVIDLLLIHWPNPRIPLADTIGALCRAKREGLTRHAGISNFTVKLVAQAVKLATEPLVTNQIEVHPYLDQARIIAACRREAGQRIFARTRPSRCPWSWSRVCTDGLFPFKVANSILHNCFIILAIIAPAGQRSAWLRYGCQARGNAPYSSNRHGHYPERLA
jgi:diketogulonate reductase-like aldo/keto reductase